MPTLQYVADPPPLTQAELDALAAEQAAMGGTVPAGGYVAEPAPAPAPIATENTPQGQAVAYEPAPAAAPVASPVSETAMANPQGTTYGAPAQPEYIPESSAYQPAPAAAPVASPVSETAMANPQGTTYGAPAQPAYNVVGGATQYTAPVPPPPAGGATEYYGGAGGQTGYVGNSQEIVTTQPNAMAPTRVPGRNEPMTVIGRQQTQARPIMVNTDPVYRGAAEFNGAERQRPASALGRAQTTIPVRRPMRGSVRGPDPVPPYAEGPTVVPPPPAPGVSQYYGAGGADAFRAPGRAAAQWETRPATETDPRFLPDPAIVADVERQTTRKEAQRRDPGTTPLQESVEDTLAQRVESFRNTDVAANRRGWGRLLSEMERVSEAIPQAPQPRSNEEVQRDEARRFSAFPPSSAPANRNIPTPDAPLSTASRTTPTTAGVGGFSLPTNLDAADRWLRDRGLTPNYGWPDSVPTPDLSEVGRMGEDTVRTWVDPQSELGYGQARPQPGTSRAAMVATSPLVQQLRSMPSAELDRAISADPTLAVLRADGVVYLRGTDIPVGLPNLETGMVDIFGSDVSLEAFAAEKAKRLGGGQAGSAGVQPANAVAPVAAPATPSTAPSTATAPSTTDTASNGTWQPSKDWNTGSSSGSTGGATGGSSGSRSTRSSGGSGGGYTRSRDNSSGYNRSSGSTRSTRTSRRSQEDEEDRDFTAEDFLEQAGGNRVRAQMLANQANAKKRRGRLRNVPQPRSSMRDDILRAIQESLTKPRKR